MATKKRPPGVQYPSETYTARSKRGRPVMQFSLPQDVVDHLEIRARHSGRSKSSIVAAALREYLEMPD